MGTKEEIEKFLENEGYESYIDGYDEAGTITKSTITLIQRSLDHFKPKPVTSQEKLKELVVNTFGKEAGEDKDIMYLYSECLKYAVEEITNKKVISNSEIEKEASKFHKSCDPDNQFLEKQADLRFGFIEGAQFYRSKLSTTVTEPKKRLKL